MLVWPQGLWGLAWRERPDLAPLPVFVRGVEDYRRIEPDFFLVKDGKIAEWTDYVVRT